MPSFPRFDGSTTQRNKRLLSQVRTTCYALSPMLDKHIDNPEAVPSEELIWRAQQLVNWVYEVSQNEGFEWPELGVTEGLVSKEDA